MKPVKRAGALAAGDGRGGGPPHGRHRPPVTTRVDRCRPAVTVSTMVVSTLRRRPPPAGVPAARGPLTPAGCTTSGTGAGQLAAWHRMGSREVSRP